MKWSGLFKNKKRNVFVLIGIVVVLLVVAGCLILFFLKGKAGGNSGFPSGGSMTQSAWLDGNLLPEGMTQLEGMENVMTASGITGAGMTQEIFEVEGLSEGLLVEEVYVSSGDEVKAGDKILKLSEESVAEAREELEQLLREADLAFRAGAIEYEQSKLEAEYEKKFAVLKGQQAEAVYQETLESLSDSVEQAQEKLDETKEELAEYEEMATVGYYEYYKVGEYKDLYDENLELLKDYMDEWGVTWAQVTGGSGFTNGDSSPEQNANVMTDSVSGSDPSLVESDTDNSDAGEKKISPSSSEVSTLQSLYRILEDNAEDYEKALEDYENAVNTGDLERQMLEYSLSALESELTSAQQNYETQVLQAKLTYEQTLAAAERAESDYETELEKIESDYEALQDAKEDAQENRDLFESSVGDGYYLASSDGTVLRTILRREQYMTGESVVFMYQNLEEMTVSVSVGQSDIDSVTVGEEVMVQSTDYGSFRGTVTEINPISNSDSRTNVTYSVTVTLTVSSGELPTNETVTVIFGLGGTGDEKEN